MLRASPGTGYTGEDGVELHVPGRRRAALLGRAARRRHHAGRVSARATRCASRPGCRCTATSSGPGITPLQAGLGWVVGWDKGDFRGTAPLARRTGAGVTRRLRGLHVEGRRPPAGGLRRCCATAADVGEVTSGNFSPMLGNGIALAFVPPDVEPGDALQIDVRGQLLDAEVVPLPFVKK